MENVFAMYRLHHSVNACARVHEADSIEGLVAYAKELYDSNMGIPNHIRDAEGNIVVDNDELYARMKELDVESDVKLGK